MTAKTQDWRDRLAELVRTPSVSSLDPAWDQGNLPVVERLADWLRAIGFACEVQPLPREPGRAPDKANLVATLGRGPGGLVLAGHTDTVPFDGSLWQADPFRVREADGRLHGLGTADMKGFFALVLEAAAAFPPAALRAALVVLATADEESSMSGARTLAAAGRALGRAAVVGEPTGLRPVRAHKGFMVREIRVRGRSGHSSDPGLGLCALEIMHRVITELLELRRELARAHGDPAFAVAGPTLNLGCIHGGDNPNRICGHCDLSIDLRLLPGMDTEAVTDRLRTRLDRVAEDSGGTVESVLLAPPVPPWEAPRDSELVRVAERLTGAPAEAVAFATESPFLAALGHDVLVLGPGAIGTAHQPEEHVEHRACERMVALLRDLIRHYCIDAPGTGRNPVPA